ncbi:MAG: hypothetical protein ACFCU1_13415 [Sumerlaeia bacterium]
MKLIQISPTQFINIEHINRIEISETRDLKYIIIYSTGGASYRCTEEETETFLPIIEDFTRSFAREIGLDG